MKCLNPITVNGKQFNCGGCINCRINYTQAWALRLVYELSTTDAASFLTLTYNDEHLPEDNGLHIEELQKFFKRLRINLKREYHEFEPKIRYYACGEYGDKSKIYKSPGAIKLHGRPHYHAIVFGLDDLNDTHRDIVRKSWQLCEPWFFDKERERDSGMQQVTPEDINYVCGYVQKKLNGVLGKEVYGQSSPPFSCCSQGLGLEFALKNKERLVANGYTFFKNHKVSIPRYFCEKFEIKKRELLDKDYKIETDISYLYEQFKKDMIKQNTWYPENPTMQAHRFELWYTRGQWQQADIIYKDFLQRRKMRGSKL